MSAARRARNPARSNQPAAATPLSDDLLTENGPADVTERAFGSANRNRLLDQYFATRGPIKPGEAWEHAYRLLLWIDRTIGLAHCYESDKCQPGRHWYPRSLAFHGWLAERLGSTPATLKDDVDWLFRNVTAGLDALVLAASKSTMVQKQRAPYAGQGFPEPGEDPKLLAIVHDALQEWLPAKLPDSVERSLVERIQTHINQENKRKNLIGEGFEDTLAAILRRIPGLAKRYDIRTRQVLHEIPGFNPVRKGQKERKVDLVLIRKPDGRRTLVTAKWSVRADREEQFTADFRDYSRAENRSEDFDYILVTNEFDPARLKRACEVRVENALMLTSVVHVQPQGPLVAYQDAVHHKNWSAPHVYKHIQTGRLTSLEGWITNLTA
ncbi:hypothetical protein [Micromonospora sagamiensis]|uniref:Restriction endonuclease n=1 Tax=Micromonospora sagamiensis TaxID=47875 RepID=A0A562WSB7_9ACTN|nr:hypothetical protein [Micromonospora sagamiensis]TWJ32314.1 hypothetical protein JD81_05889 [Micromonospora sagamiensis]BCL14621.1 hypothetical protein GCM10017556_23600 [Micromonospora sagamiensis]